jgi:hypothetical protein
MSRLVLLLVLAGCGDQGPMKTVARVVCPEEDDSPDVWVVTTNNGGTCDVVGTNCHKVDDTTLECLLFCDPQTVHLP